MEVYDIDKLISLLNKQKERGLYYAGHVDIERILNESIHTPPEIKDEGNTIAHLEFHVSNGYNTPFPAPKLFSMLLQISTSKCLRWRKNGVIASIYPDVLLSQLKVLDKDSKLKRTLGKMYVHGKKMCTQTKKYQNVNNRTCLELLGLYPDDYKELRKLGYIKGRTLVEVINNMERI